MDIFILSITVFVNQLVFIGSRTWNIRAIAENNVKKVLLTGTIIHISWLMGIAIGATSVAQVIINFEWKYLPVIASSLLGSLLGSYIGLQDKTKRNR